MSKPGTVTTVWTDFDQFVSPLNIPTARIGDAEPMIMGNGPETHPCIKMRTFGKASGGNQNNSKKGRQQRRRKSGRTDANR